MRSAATPKILSLYRDHPRVSASLPRVLQNGNTVDELTGHCAECDEAIPDDQFRGTVTEAFGVTVVEAVGVCHPCNLITKFLFRFRPDGTVDILTREGRWAKYLFESRTQKKARILKTAKAKARRIAAEAAVALALLSPIIAYLLLRR